MDQRWREGLARLTIPNPSCPVVGCGCDEPAGMVCLNVVDVSVMEPELGELGNLSQRRGQAHTVSRGACRVLLQAQGFGKPRQRAPQIAFLVQLISRGDILADEVSFRVRPGAANSKGGQWQAD